ncbi:MAG: histidinol-phosphate transaminase [Gammaproteobacteria bacterium]|nr:histidinol-phosphate transaminase [Gammaproteobacteria bacterium]
MTDSNVNAPSLAEQLIRNNLKALKPYESARRLFKMSDSSEVETAWLNANENPYLPDIKINPALYNRYPDFQPEPLINAYAKYAKVTNQQVLATRGADEGIELLIRTFCETNDSVLICPPTYGMYAISSETNQANIIKVNALDDFQLNVDEVVKQINEVSNKVKIVFVCSPNNPTGQIIKRDDLIAVIEAAQGKAIVVADEAYIEFCLEASVIELINQYDNLVVLRTLSKAFGLAGLRCGFTLSNTDIIDALKKVIAPYPVPAPVAQIATNSLSNDGLVWMLDKVSQLNSLRDDFIEFAKTLSFVESVYPSQTNFVLLKLKQNMTSQQVMDTFSKQHILLRDQSKQVMLGSTVRVSIGNTEQMAQVQQIFSEVEQTL